MTVSLANNSNAIVYLCLERIILNEKYIGFFVHLLSAPHRLLQFFHLKAWGQGLFELFGLFLVLDDQGVQEAGATHLELGTVRILLDFD